MKTGMIIKTDGGSFALSVEDSYILISLARECLTKLQIRNSIEPDVL